MPGAEFDAYTKRQFVNESNNINSLGDHYIWSTIKTLPATLPELMTMDRARRTGVTGTLSNFRRNLTSGVDRMGLASDAVFNLLGADNTYPRVNYQPDPIVDETRQSGF